MEQKNSGDGVCRGRSLPCCEIDIAVSDADMDDKGLFIIIGESVIFLHTRRLRVTKGNLFRRKVTIKTPCCFEPNEYES